MVKIVLDSYVYTKSYLILKSKNVVKFYVHIRPIFSCRVTFNICIQGTAFPLCSINIVCIYRSRHWTQFGIPFYLIHTYISHRWLFMVDHKVICSADLIIHSYIYCHCIWMMFTYCAILRMVFAIQTLSSSARLQVISKLSMTALKIGNLMQ